MNLDNVRIAVIGLGYVGLPLAVAFAEKLPVVGFDIDTKRIDELQNGVDSTLEIEKELLRKVLIKDIKSFNKSGVKGMFCSYLRSDIANCNVFIITVPTPTDENNNPVLSPMKQATQDVACLLKKGDVVIYESTVYPGVTEEVMVPILEEISQLKFNSDFFVGYSPERINPGDKNRTLSSIVKITSGSTPDSAKHIDNLYKEIIKAGTYLAPSIKVAEAAKVIENSQRDLNIAFVNELSKIFNLLGLDTLQVLEAASTKWNFLPFKPGLVGGHCIGVDPFYLTHKAQEIGYHPEVILSGRRLNDSMGKYVAGEVVNLMKRKNLRIAESQVLILGFTFKENCPDFRNTRVADIYYELENFDMKVVVYDPWVNIQEVKREYKDLSILSQEPNYLEYSSVILAVGHTSFRSLNIRKSDCQVIYDVKGILPKNYVDGRL